MSEPLELRVEAARCIRCGACAALDPTLFDVSAAASRVARQPGQGEELRAVAARWLCPADAIRAGSGHGAPEPTAQVSAAEHREEAPLFDTLATGAERVRWKLADVPWSDLRASSVPPELRVVVREMAFSENATFSATQRFLDAFSDDVEFSQWIAVWFYEETKHPFVLMEWLRRVGETLPGDFVVRGRVSTPFMRSRVGTLVTNVISEITVSHAYLYLARTSPEPVLGRLASLIAGDEARHAASFFRFARRQLESVPDGGVRERARGLEVLHAWLSNGQSVTHPVQQMLERLARAGAGGALDMDYDAIRLRVVRVIGLLLDLPVRRVEDVGGVLRELLARR
jgi:ferredoxin